MMTRRRIMWGVANAIGVPCPTQRAAVRSSQLVGGAVWCTVPAVGSEFEIHLYACPRAQEVLSCPTIASRIKDTKAAREVTALQVRARVNVRCFLQ